jgi:hypothetical protein
MTTLISSQHSAPLGSLTSASDFCPCRTPQHMVSLFLLPCSDPTLLTVRAVSGHATGTGVSQRTQQITVLFPEGRSKTNLGDALFGSGTWSDNKLRVKKDEEPHSRTADSAERSFCVAPVTGCAQVHNRQTANWCVPASSRFSAFPIVF